MCVLPNEMRRCPEVLPDDATDLIKRLLRRNPKSRLGAGPLTSTTDSRTAEDSTASGEGFQTGGMRVGDGDHFDNGGGGFEALKAHPFFRGQKFIGEGQVYDCCKWFA